MIHLITKRLLVGLSFLSTLTHACTNVLVTPGASENGNAMIAYNADSGNLMGMLYHYPASSHKDDSEQKMRQVWNWDTAVYLGEIPEAKETFNVVGKMMKVLILCTRRRRVLLLVLFLFFIHF